MVSATLEFQREEVLIVEDTVRHDKDRWEQLARANLRYSRPRYDPHGMIWEVEGQDVLCLASGGSQQLTAFGVLGRT